MIECRNLSKRYGGRTVVDDLSFEVRAGAVTGFVGANGAGKSTTLRLMLDLDHGSGLTRFDGRRFRELADPIRSVGAVLEARDFHPGRSARHHLCMLAVGGGVPLRRVDEVLAVVGLAEVADRRPGGFSLGMSQRLGLAAALLGDPQTVILDEPANGLDLQGIRWLRTLLRRFAAEGRTVLIASHQLPELEEMADDVIVLDRGRLIAGSGVTEFVRDNGGTTLADAFLAVTTRNEQVSA